MTIRFHHLEKVTVAGVMLASSALGQTPASTINPGTPWPATDALGRSLPIAQEPAAIRPERCVGIFYFLWHDQPWNSQQIVHPPNDLAKILPQDPDILNKPDSPLWGVPGDPYYWGEPLYGYYNISDPWVLRRHANLLADAGIDTVIFDTTNRATYRAEYMKLCEVWTQVRKEGGRTPRICFMVNTQAGDTAKEIHKDLYQPGLYKDLWFTWQDKPLLICDPAEATPELKEFFTLCKAHWPFELVNTQNAWHWEATYPQVYSYDQDPARPEQVNVAVAQNLRISDGKVTNMSEGDARGRSFHNGKRDTSPGAVNQGHNFEEQWQRAHELNPPFVMVTGWNEWIAGKFSRPGRPVVFVDQYDQEHSRDIEPVTGLHNDNYYYQLVANVRRYKGHPPVPVVTPEKTIDPAAGFDQWQDVGPEFTDHSFDNGPRDFGQGARKYQNKSGRNDIVAAKAARDSNNLYFQVRTREVLTPMTDPNWMWLLIDADRNPKTGWEGYDFIVNRTIEGGESWLEKNTGGWNWKKTGKVRIQITGKNLMLPIPRESLGLKSSADLNFKWWDNPQKPGDIMDSYLSGDAAPDGRFSYFYTGGSSATASQNK